MKKMLVFSMGTAVAGGLLAAALFADSEHGYREHEGREHGNRGGGVAVVSNDSYATECGACHFAYQPGLLPAASWTQLMDGLADHFGENAELDDATRQALSTYLTENAGDVKPSKVFAELARRSTETPLRISELAGFSHEHRKIPARLVQDNPQVQSLSHCARCHTDAAQGGYGEHQVNIPGYGRFED